jgi:adenylate cyclase
MAVPSAKAFVASTSTLTRLENQMTGGESLRRRLAAILAADIAGYSRLMGQDEAATVRDLKGHQATILPLVERYGGHIVDTAGDGILAEFPSVVAATECAVEIQTVMAARNADVPEQRRMLFRIGINLGDVIHDETRIYGDGINVAARLEALAAPGGVLVSHAVHEQVRDRLALAFEDLGDRELKNIARPVRVFRLRARGETAAAPAPTLSLPEKPSIAVLPFANMSGDPEQEYFVDGLVEEIITALSRTRALFVIARNSSFSYKGTSPDIRRVGRELGVRYVLEGSVRKAGNRLRITGQLIDAQSGAHIWADRFDGELADIFELQDQVAGRVAVAIVPTLERAHMQRSSTKPTENLDAYDCCLRGWACIDQFTREANIKALGYFERAIEPACSTASSPNAGTPSRPRRSAACCGSAARA